MSRQEYVDTIKSTAQSLATRLTMGILVAEFPFLGAPIFYKLTEMVVNYVMGKLIKQTEFGMFFLFIDVRTNEQGRAFFEAAQKNQLAQKTGTAEEKARAEKDLINKFAAFASWTS